MVQELLTKHRFVMILNCLVQVSFGPLFDGAVVDKACLPSLVRATAINASRALRTPLVAYRGR